MAWSTAAERKGSPSRARAAGIATARLPLAEHLQLGLEQHRSLAVNHVFEIVMHRARGLEWGDAMLKAMPPRRGATRKDDDGGGADRAAGYSQSVKL